MIEDNFKDGNCIINRDYRVGIWDVHEACPIQIFIINVIIDFR